MNSATQFAVALLVITLLWMLIALRNVNKREYFSGREGQGILKGIFLALAITLLMAVGSAVFAGEYLNKFTVFAGLDGVKGDSPLCRPDGVDDKTTSNLGFRLNLYQTDDKKFTARSKYTHHSCAFGVDNNSYDALGIELEYTLFEK